MIQLCFEKKDLQNMVQSLAQQADEVRRQQLEIIASKQFINISTDQIEEYYSKRLLLIENNRSNIEFMLKKMHEAKIAGGDIVAVMTIIDREKTAKA